MEVQINVYQGSKPGEVVVEETSPQDQWLFTTTFTGRGETAAHERASAYAHFLKSIHAGAMRIAREGK